MALRLKLFGVLRSVRLMRQNVMSTSVMLPKNLEHKNKEYRTENNLVYIEDPDTFGTLSKTKIVPDNPVLEDKGDIEEQQFLENIPLPSQKLTVKQYADLIKQYLNHKRLKEAIDVLEIRMLRTDRVKPENYIYNILIGACADFGYTKKAFKLFNEMKRRALKPTGATYTCLFQACINSPWPKNELKNAHNLRNLMEEKGIKPNLTNYNTMVKVFGRCGDLPMAFKIVDEMIEKKIKIRVHTFNHLLQACITDKDTGLRHALVVWRKMLKMREKPNIYSFNLMLRCVRDCNLGSKEDFEELLDIIFKEQMAIESKKKILQIASQPNQIINKQDRTTKSLPLDDSIPIPNTEKMKIDEEVSLNKVKTEENSHNIVQKNEIVPVENDNVTIQFLDKVKKPVVDVNERTVPNLLSRQLNMEQVLSFQEVHTTQDKFAVIGGQDDFLKEMEQYSVKPDIKTFTQMLQVIEQTREAEVQLIESMQALGVKADIDFYNMLIKKRCMRLDYDGAFEVKEIIKKDSKKRNPLKKRHRLNLNIMTYGVLAMACKTKENAVELLNEMKEEELKVNVQILGTLLRQGTSSNNFGYIVYIMNILKSENLQVNDTFMKHLEAFNDKCTNKIQKDENGQYKCSEAFIKSYEKFVNFYEKWLKDVNIEEALKPEHPWEQFKNTYPETVQRQNFEIVEPKKFYKRNRKYVKYTPRF